MVQIDLEATPGCIQYALHILGDKWTALIIRDLSAEFTKFSELETSLGGISPRTLSQRLSKLEQCGIVAKRLYCEHPPRYAYELTQKGVELQAIIVKMAEWGARHHASCPQQLAD